MRRGGSELIVGRLTEQGRAHYQFRDSEDLSYFVRVLTDRGEKVLWGKDLERAIGVAATQPHIGDLIGARRVGREAVTLTDRKRDPEGRVLTQTEHHAHRTRWVVEKVKFFADRARLARLVRDAHVDARESVRAHPELKATFLSLRSAEELAARRIANPQDRERFLALLREAMANSVTQGEPLPAVRLREQPQTPDTKRPLPSPRTRSDDRTR